MYVLEVHTCLCVVRLVFACDRGLWRIVCRWTVRGPQRPTPRGGDAIGCDDAWCRRWRRGTVRRRRDRDRDSNDAGVYDDDDDDDDGVCVCAEHTY